MAEQSLAETLRPRFGDLVENGWASEANPTRRGYFVREFKRTGRLNPGLTWEITDGNGNFWTFRPRDVGERLTVTPRSLPPPPAEGVRERVARLEEALRPFAAIIRPQGAKLHHPINYTPVVATFADVERAQAALSPPLAGEGE